MRRLAAGEGAPGGRPPAPARARPLWATRSGLRLLAAAAGEAPARFRRTTPLAGGAVARPGRPRGSRALGRLARHPRHTRDLIRLGQHLRRAVAAARRAGRAVELVDWQGPVTAPVRFPTDDPALARLAVRLGLVAPPGRAAVRPGRAGRGRPPAARRAAADAADRVGPRHRGAGAAARASCATTSAGAPRRPPAARWRWSSPPPPRARRSSTGWSPSWPRGRRARCRRCGRRPPIGWSRAGRWGRSGGRSASPAGARRRPDPNSSTDCAAISPAEATESRRTIVADRPDRRQEEPMTEPPPSPRRTPPRRRRRPARRRRSSSWPTGRGPRPPATRWPRWPPTPPPGRACDAAAAAGAGRRARPPPRPARARPAPAGRRRARRRRPGRAGDRAPGSARVLRLPPPVVLLVLARARWFLPAAGPPDPRRIALARALLDGLARRRPPVDAAPARLPAPGARRGRGMGPGRPQRRQAGPPAARPAPPAAQPVGGGGAGAAGGGGRPPARGALPRRAHARPAPGRGAGAVLARRRPAGADAARARGDAAGQRRARREERAPVRHAEVADEPAAGPAAGGDRGGPAGAPGAAGWRRSGRPRAGRSATSSSARATARRWTGRTSRGISSGWRRGRACRR